jgi:hypothetical protein
LLGPISIVAARRRCSNGLPGAGCATVLHHYEPDEP